MQENTTATRNKPDILGTAMLDFMQGKNDENITTWTTIAGEDILPLSYLFRGYDQMPAIEQKALDLSMGSVLDIGCGSGSHSLWLQERKMEVTAIDISPGAVETCRLRGVKNARVQDIWDLKGETFDTLLMLMNGMGICGRLEKLPALLGKLKGLLKPGAQILADSSDLIYMFDEESDMPLPSDHYYGEVLFRTKYRELEGELFPWLYVDFHNLELHANQVGLSCEKVCDGEHYDYLARMTLK
jgi:SAM-dependent methyltransferase